MENTPSALTDPELLRLLFIHYLNRIHHGKKYLREHLPGVIDLANSRVLKHAIEELLDDVKKQLKRMDEIYARLGAEPADEIDPPIKSIVREACLINRGKENHEVINDMDVMMHMQLVEHVNIISYRMLRLIASKLKYQEIEQLLIECFDESMDNDQLFLMISNEYIEGQ